MAVTDVAMRSALEHAARLQVLLRVARAAVQRFDLPADVSVRLINLSENATYKIEDPATQRTWAMRVHRDGYHAHAAILSELAWLTAVRADGAAITPIAVPGRDGELIQSVAVPDLAKPRRVVLSQWEAGVEPSPDDRQGFAALGEIAARLHRHVRTWRRPAWFERFTWDFDTALGERPHWGRWRDGMGMTPELAHLFARTAARIADRLQRFGQGLERFGLVHGDMRLANVLTDGDQVKLIDFDDCGFSWFLYDAATTVSFFEHEPEVPELLAAWLQGYRRVAELSAADEAELWTFVMLRRLLLVAWIGSHAETELARSMGVAYTQATAPLCEHYLGRH
jgi:Ser/Thr protein kinase RdoA (MazF antagonist)